jgi:hypothetical protein
MKVSELTGALLDYWVARVMHPKESITIRESSLGVKGCYLLDTDDNEWKFYTPSRRWSDGGPIIDRKRIILKPYDDGGWGSALDFDGDARGGIFDGTSQEGETPLVAAMRVHVASHYGDIVPDSID